MTSAPASTTGYHTFHPDVSINYQLNRFSDGTPASVGELTAAARRITGYPDYTRERLALSDAADAEGGPLASALYQRSAEFCMLPDDRAKIPLGADSLPRCALFSGSMGRARTSSPTGAPTCTPTGSPRRPPWVPS